MISKDIDIRVRYKDTDKMGVVYHSNYIVFYEVARTEMFRELGISYAELEKRGVIMPILEVESKYREPAYYDDLITVRASVSEVPMARLTVTYEIFNAEGRTINTGRTVLGFVNSELMRPCRAPKEMVDLIAERL